MTDMVGPDLTIEDDPSAANVAAIEERVAAYNIAATGYDDYRPLAVFVRDASGAILAGLTGFTWGGTLKIAYLWVRDDLRRQGYGTRLVRAAEREAIARGCLYAVLDTHSFQAPAFYPRLGYTQCGRAEEWPAGHQQLYFHKRLR
jgi:GNAT superfamily N-acetyltransferase